MQAISRRLFCKGVVAGGAMLASGGRVWAAPDWVDQRRVGPFVCLSAFPLVGCETLLNELHPLEQELRRVLAIEPCKSDIYLHLMANRRQHEQYIAERFPSVPYRRALFVKQDGVASVFAYLNKELAVDVRHECTHALLHGDLPMVPLWLDEGLAEYFEPPKPARGKHHEHMRSIGFDLHSRRVRSIAKLETKEKLEDLSALDYRSAWAWVHFMLHGPAAAHAELVGFMSDIRRYVAPGKLSERLAKVVPHSRARLGRHFEDMRSA